MTAIYADDLRCGDRVQLPNGATMRVASLWEFSCGVVWAFDADGGWQAWNVWETVEVSDE